MPARPTDQDVTVVIVAGGMAIFAGAAGLPAGLSEEQLAAVAGRVVGGEIDRPVSVLYARQVHGRVSYSFAAHRPLPTRPYLVGECDALITADPYVALTVRTADCLPIALAGGGAVAMIHAGWRGLEADVLGAAVNRLGAEFGVAPDALEAVIGVGVGPCHYAVGGEVIDGLARLLPNRALWERGGAVDLSGYAAARLAALGLAGDRVTVLPGCTACDRRYHSHRRDGAPSGRQWSAVVLTGETSAGA